MIALIDRLLASEEPAIRYKTLSKVLREDEGEKEVKKARNQIRECPRVQALLANRDSQGRVEPADYPYQKWQWPDGGWNCDKKPEAAKSSFYETIAPLRGMVAYAKHTDDNQAKESARKAAEVFLIRRLYKRKTDGQRMKSAFTSLHYPLYWHYDIIHGLKVMAEGGFIQDERCTDALDLLESMQLEQGGWPATAKHYAGVDLTKHGYDLVHWGGTAKTKMNEWVTVDALAVLAASGRLSP